MLHHSIAEDATKSLQRLNADWTHVISAFLWILLLTVTLQQ